MFEQEQFIYEIIIPQRLLFYRKSYREKRLSNTFLSYRIYSFNQTFDLSLIKNDIFLSPSFFVQYFNENQTWINRDIEDCFYQGYVNENHLSTISISLCNGLFGTFIYDNIEYFIEPKYYKNSSSWNFEHLIYTHKDLSLSKELTIHCPVDGIPYFEQQHNSHYYRSHHLIRRRKKRQYDFDSMAKHVEILVAYDESIKEFHSDIDIKSYILTLFSYVSHLYSDASIGNNIKIWLVKLIELGKDLSNDIESTGDAADILNKFCIWQREYNIQETYDAAVLLTSERCKLICKVTNDYLERSFIFNDRVDDGTPCEHENESRDICINGICMPFGCDLKYGSNATEDICGVCNGQNRTCKLIKGQKIVANFGITDIITIPINTTHVSITQISSKKDLYYLAVKYINGTYILNDLHSLQLYNIKIRIGSARLIYSGSNSINESILIIGRLKVPLEIQIISISQSDLSTTIVHWEYYIPLDEKDFIQQYGDYSLDYYCDRPCQGFKQVKKCMIYEKEYDLIYCLIFKIPFEYIQEQCNNDCILKWTIKYEQTCSTRCGDGYKRVLYECTKTSLSIESIDEDICRKYIGEKPKDIISCIGDCTDTGWVYGNWSNCYYDKNCIRKRSIECRNSSNFVIANDYCTSDFMFDIERCAEVDCEQSRWNFTTWSDCDCISKLRERNVSCIRYGKQVSDQDCSYEPKPDETISCFNECFIPNWQTYSWQPCTATCSSYKGIRHRRVVCSYHSSIVEDDYCDQQLKPIEQEWCTTNITCLTWFIGEWSSCSVTCGQGYQQRIVYCNDPSRPWLRISDNECQTLLGEHSKPDEQKNCSITECPYWQISPWSNCSGKCGLQKRYRSILCLHNGLEIDNNYCLKIYNEKPSTIEICNQQLYCPHWITDIWSDCSVTCGIGIQYRSVLCKNQDQIVFEDECENHHRPIMMKQCHMNSCQNDTPIWMTSDWTQCDLQTCLQTRTVRCISSISKRNLSMFECTQNQIQPLTNRICPISDCLEWRVAYWHGCPIKCGLGIEYGSGFHCYTRQIPIRKLNPTECELVQPQLVKPILRRVCRRNCIEWRTGGWSEVKI
ncbi:unnamed protein product [Rotaria sp. Silwood1]|nr:unnamed protein product [Rotaria sp. Silwood1]